MQASYYVKVWNFVTNMSVTFDVGDKWFKKVILLDLYHGILMNSHYRLG